MDPNSSAEYAFDLFQVNDTNSSFGASEDILSSKKSLLKHSVFRTIGFVLSYILIFITGLFGNTMVVIVIYLKPQMQTVTNRFIFNLAVADLLVILFCMPCTLAATIFTPWILGPYMCKIMSYIQGVSVFASAYSLVAVTLDRCQGMYRPMKRGHGLSDYQASILISIIWMIALILIFPWLIVFQVIPSHNSSTGPFCVEIWSTAQKEKYYYLFIILSFGFGVPMVIILITNLFIWRKVSRRKLPQHSACDSSIKQMHRKTRTEVRRMLALVTLTFLLCWLPLYLIVTRVKVFSHVPISSWETSVLNVMLPLAQLLGSINSAANPIIYALVNTKFRNFFLAILCRRKNNFDRQSLYCRAIELNRRNAISVRTGSENMCGTSTQSSSLYTSLKGYCHSRNFLVSANRSSENNSRKINAKELKRK